MALIGLFGVLYSQRAPLQVALNGAFSAIAKELQDERVHLIARISEQEILLAQYKLSLLERDGEIRGLKQSRDSLMALLRRSGTPIPGEFNT